MSSKVRVVRTKQPKFPANSLCIQLQCGSQTCIPQQFTAKTRVKGFHGKHEGIELSFEISHVSFSLFDVCLSCDLFVKQCRVEETSETFQAQHLIGCFGFGCCRDSAVWHWKRSSYIGHAYMECGSE